MLISNRIVTLFGVGVIISGILVVSSQNPINAIVNLILAFVNSVGLFLILGVDFIGVLYVIVYVGAIAILFLFVVMMLNVRKIEWHSLPKASRTYPLGFIIGLLYMVELYDFIRQPNDGLKRKIVESTSMLEISTKSNIEGIGEMLYKESGFEYLFVISLILLVAMMGAIMLTKEKEDEGISV
jgi:NADH-quinone oxidoreductase subunit J